MKIEELQEITKGNPQACDFLCKYTAYCHLIDDIVDNPGSVTETRLVKEQIEFLEQLVMNPWVQQHIGLLWPLVVTGANSWLDSNRWKSSDNEKLKSSVDTLKGQYHEVAWFTAYLCGGLEHMREMTTKYREYDYETKEN